MNFVDANGLRFAYLSEGSGPLVLLLHGFPDTAHTWDGVRARIAEKGYRAVSPFLRGYHPTGVPARDADAETLARDVLALIEALGAPDAVVVGHDWGAAAAYGAAALGPGVVRKLFAVAIPHPATISATPGRLWAGRHFAAYKLPGAAGRFARNDFAALPAIYRRWSPTWSPPSSEFAEVRECFSHRASLDAAFGYYRALRLTAPAFLRKALEVPTVAFRGLHDPVFSGSDYEQARAMFARGYEIEAMPGGHFLHREHPREFAERLLAHL